MIDGKIKCDLGEAGRREWNEREDGKRIFKHSPKILKKRFLFGPELKKSLSSNYPKIISVLFFLLL